MQTIKDKKCKSCLDMFTPFRPLQNTCSPKCALEYVTRERSEKDRKAFNAETRKMKEALKTKRDYIKEAQPVFNKFIRLRDKDEPCISCGRYEHEITEPLTARGGGKWDCGHFLTIGAFPELRFTEDNAHKQCKSCNGGSGNFTKKNHTVGQEYEERIISKIGQDRVDWLKGPHEPAKWTIEDLKEIKTIYRTKFKQLEEV